MTPKEIFEEISEKFVEFEDTVKEVNGVFQFHITGDDGGDWAMDCREAKIIDGSVDDPDTTLSIDQEDFEAIYQGELNGMQAFAMGKLKVTGNLPLSLKIQTLLTL